MAPVGGEPEATLVKDGRARCVIVVPERASATVRHAAGELKRYLKLMTGAEVPILQQKGGRGAAAPERVQVHVGPTKLARQQLAGKLATNEERVLIRTGPDGVFICGGGERGTLFAIYRFLERLGCRWLAPEFEYVPNRPTLQVARLAVASEPAFRWRLFQGRSEELEASRAKDGLQQPVLERDSRTQWPLLLLAQGSAQRARLLLQ